MSPARREEEQLRAYRLGTAVGMMIGREALQNPAQTQKTLEFSDEATVCYLNGVGDAMAGCVIGDESHGNR